MCNYNMLLYKILKLPLQGSSLSSLIGLWFFLAVTAFIKLWLVASQNLTALGGAVYDDRLFIDIATALLNNKWLGIYSNRTLVKGPFYPMWIAAVFKSGIPLLLAQHLLYVAACILFVIAIKPLIYSRLRFLFIFVVLIFNPMSYTAGIMPQVIREGIYPALTIFVVSCAIGLLLRRKDRLLILFVWSIGLGIALSAFWLTREEGIWIMPSIIVLMGFVVFGILRARPVVWQKIFLFVLPVVICWMVVAGISGINKIRYGIFAISELKSRDFLEAYGALLRIKHKDWRPTIPVPKDVLDKVYEVSPAFAELRPALEGDIGKQWSNMFKNVREVISRDPEFARKVKAYFDADASKIWGAALYDDSGIHGGWFMWAFRDAVAAAGYHSSGTAAANYYRRLATELDAACDDGRLACSAKRLSLMPPWHEEYNYPFLRTFTHGVAYLARLEGFNAKPDPSAGDESSLKLFRIMTRESLSPLQTGRNRLKLDLLGWLGIVYKVAVPFLSVVAAIGYFISAILIYKKHVIAISWIISTSLFIAVAVRLVMLSFIHVTSFPAIIPQYLAPCYPLLLMFIIFSFTGFFRETMPALLRRADR